MCLRHKYAQWFQICVFRQIIVYEGFRYIPASSRLLLSSAIYIAISTIVKMYFVKY